MSARPPPPKVAITAKRNLKTFVGLTGPSFVAPTGPLSVVPMGHNVVAPPGLDFTATVGEYVAPTGPNFTATVGDVAAPPGNVVASKRPALHGPKYTDFNSSLEFLISLKVEIPHLVRLWLVLLLRRGVRLQ